MKSSKRKMQNAKLQFKTQNFIICFFMVLLFAFCALNSFAQETLTITTYYPSPFGNYQELRSQRMAIGDTWVQNSNICWTAAGACPGTAVNPDPETALVVEGKVGIGTAQPERGLHIKGGPNWPSIILEEVGNNPGQVADLFFRKARGTVNSLNDVQVGDGLGSVEFTGYRNGVYRDTAAISSDVESLGANIVRGGLIFNTADTAGTLTDRMRIDQDGNVGIGTVTPLTRLEIKGTDAVPGGNIGFMNRTTHPNTGAVLTEGLLRVQQSDLADQASYDSELVLSFFSNPVANARNSIFIGPESTFSPGKGRIQLCSNIVEVLDASVGIGIPAPAEKLDVGGNVQATSFIYSSDSSLKKDICDIPDALRKVRGLHGVNFKWKNNNQADVGFIAQEVEKVFPELVVTNNNTGLKSIKYGNLIAPLVEAVKQQQKQIEKLEKRIQELEKGR